MKYINKALPICLIAHGFACTGCTSSLMLQLEENKALVRRAAEELDRANLAAFMELHASDYVYHGPGSAKPMARREFEQSFLMGFDAFGDTSRTIEDMIAEGDRVASWMTSGRNHTCFMFRLTEGKIVESWNMIDIQSDGKMYYFPEPVLT